MVDMVHLAGDAVAGTGPGQQDRDVVFSGNHQRVAGHSGGPVQYKLRHTLQLLCHGFYSCTLQVITTCAFSCSQ